MESINLNTIFRKVIRMHASGPAEQLLDNAIISCLCYFDTFKYPMKLEEIHAFLPYFRASKHVLKQRLNSYPLSNHIVNHSGYYFLPSHSREIVKLRQIHEEFAERRWKTANIMTRIIKIFPFVRGVMISGELSKNVSQKNSDIDYFIITAPNRMWITRTLLTLFKKIFLLNKKKYLCLNYFRTEDYLVFNKHNDFYMAVEILTLKPVYNLSFYENIVEQNPWLFEFFPNYPGNYHNNNFTHQRQSSIQFILEKIFGIFNLDKWDTRLLYFMKKVWRKRYPHLSQEELEKRFICTKSESSAFVDESYGTIMERYRKLYNEMRLFLPSNVHRSKSNYRKKKIQRISV